MFFPSLLKKAAQASEEGLEIDINLSQYVVTNGTIIIYELEVPARAVMEVTHFGNYLGTYEAWGSVTWIFLRNNIPIVPYNDMKDQIGYGSELRKIVNVKVQGGDIFSAQIQNVYPDSVACGIVLKGSLRSSGY